MQDSTIRKNFVALFTPGRVLVLVVALGAALRVYKVGALSLWLDEGFTVYFSRLPWHTVLGLDGAYDAHPPLYYAIVKVASLAVPEVLSGRLISVVAGTATIPVLYSLVARLAGAWVGVLSSLVLAVSPLHIWYSQEARQYVPAALLVCASYLALVAFSQTLRVGWAVLYFTTLLVGVYIEYSAVYALIPQVLILAVVIRREGTRAIPAVLAVAGAVVGFLAWLPQLARATGFAGDPSRLAVTPLRAYPNNLV